MRSKSSYQSVIPASPAEAAIAAATWERRGILGRLVRVDGVETTEHAAAGAAYLAAAA